MESCLSICNYLKEKELKFLREKYDCIYYNKKEKELENLKQIIKNKNIINEEEFLEIRSLAKSNGGLLNSNFRLFYYNLIMNYLKENSKNQIITDIEELNIKAKYSTELKEDLKRSIINIFLENHDENLHYKQDYFKFINNFFDSTNYEYYQGFQEITIYIYMLNSINKLENHNAFLFLNRFSEIYLSNYLNKTCKFGFDSILVLLSDIICSIDKEVNRSLIEITNTKPYYALSWIITWFAHKNTDLYLQYRIIDYLLCSHPSTIYFLSALIIIDEFSKFKKTNSLSEDDLEVIYNYYFYNSAIILMHFQQLDISKLNFEKLIEKTEIIMSNVNVEKIITRNPNFKKFNNDLFIKRFYKNRKSNTLIYMLMIGIFVYISYYINTMLD